MRYLLLVILNLPIVFIALLNIATNYKMKKISKSRAKHQLLLWIIIGICIFGAFPIYNHLNGRPPFLAELSVFDILQTTTIIYLIWIINFQRQKIEKNEKTLRDIQTEISIRLSKK